LGILWFDAHADFNTIDTSPSGNLHGVPIAVLCGHTLSELTFGKLLYTDQFAYYGLRDIDSLEFNRIQNYNMLIINSFLEIQNWIEYFDKIHISFDMDCLDPSIFSFVNTPVKNGLLLEDIFPVLQEIKKNNKLLSVDLVEYNPDKGINNLLIIKILEKMLL
jgi:arginase